MPQQKRYVAEATVDCNCKNGPDCSNNCPKHNAHWGVFDVEDGSYFAKGTKAKMIQLAALLNQYLVAGVTIIG